MDQHNMSRFYMLLTPQLEKVKMCETELDVKKKKNGKRWNLLTRTKETCLQSGASVS